MDAVHRKIEVLIHTGGHEVQTVIQVVRPGDLFTTGRSRLSLVAEDALDGPAGHLRRQRLKQRVIDRKAEQALFELADPTRFGLAQLLWLLGGKLEQRGILIFRSGHGRSLRETLAAQLSSEGIRTERNYGDVFGLLLAGGRARLILTIK